MTEKMTSLEYAKSFAPASRIPESFLTMGDVVHMLERIIQLNADLANANEGAKLMHSLAMNGETSVLSRLDNGADVQDAVRWQDAPKKLTAREIALPNGKLRSYASYKDTGKAQPLSAEEVDGERLGE